MAEFKISRIRYTWKGAWNTSTAYIKDDVVQFGGSTWVCMRNHTASAFQTDQEYLANPNDTDFTPAWRKMQDGYAFVGDWEEDTLYSPGDVTLYGGRLYICTTSHTSSITFEDNNDKWFVYLNLINWSNDWAADTRYGIGDLVKYNGIVYRCNTEHTSQSAAEGLEADLIKWTGYYANVEYVGEWADDTRYRPNDLVKYNGTIYRCLTGHTSAGSIERNNFTTEFPGFKFAGIWDSSELYSAGDIVRHGGYLYKAARINTSVSPDEYSYGFTADWHLISKAVNFRGAWTMSDNYKTGDLVRRGGNLYVALTDRFEDGSSSDYMDSDNWELVAPAFNWRDGWQIDQVYQPGDVVNYRGATWACNYGHDSSYQNFPSDDNGSGNWYWDRVVDTGIPSGLSNRGDLLTYDFFRENIGDGSSLGVTRAGVGNRDELLTIDSEHSLTYAVWGNNDKFVHVAPDGVDDTTDPDRGINPFKPWRSIQFATQVLESWGEAAKQTTINLRTGKYFETLPIVLPEGVSIVGDELRGCTVSPAPAVAALANDLDYSVAALQHISSLLPDIMKGIAVEPTEGNNEVQSDLTVSTTTINVSQVGGEEIQEEVTTTTFLSTSDEVINSVQALIQDIIDYITYYIDGSGNVPTMVGTNTGKTDPYVDGVVWTDSRDILEMLKEWIAAEASAYIAATFPDYEFDANLCKRDMRKYVDAWKYDIIYTGNYKSLWAGRWYKNAVLGSETEDMFYMRNSTGLRNMTLEGLSGTLSPPAVNELYRRPTGGAFTSLDPGWGPDDNRVWIHSRSPFMSNVTTFGENCTGQKVDGALHNGGYRSFVSNDYTQIISDGIGAWITNGGRAELVSVFTYYCQIGMFAEQGGIIRATNGNSSYGDYGAVADGNDPLETPRYGTVNTRTGNAVVASAFAGEINDYILALEFENAGQDYTTASYQFIGSGTNAHVVQEDIRDNAVFEFQIKNAPDAVGGNPGGANYTLIGNNAQAGNTTGITIASNDDHTEEELLGLRIIITSGDGTGQFGYVTAYNDLTKRAEVSKESDDTPGWDHVIPGTPPVTAMTTNATYKFEPRMTVSEPPYSSDTADMVLGAQWHSISYGETYEVYNNVSGSEGEGDTIDVIPFVATWNVVKNGRAYEVEMVQGGAGYEAGQTVTIAASEVGGEDNENDITITVVTVSDDSTNSILTFAASGVARSGRWVTTGQVGDKVVSTADGVTWDENTLPSAGSWKVIAGHDENSNPCFVAVKRASSAAAISYDGRTWTSKTLPASRNWSGISYGNGVFLAVSENLNSGAYSVDGGKTWSSTTLPDSVDSTIQQWVDVTYGQAHFVVLANSDNSVAKGSYDADTDTWTWNTYVMDVIADSSQVNWVSITYGHNKFLAITNDGIISYSFDAMTWYNPELIGYDGMPTQDGSTLHEWRQVRYGQGIFMAVGNTAGRDVGADPTLGPTTWIVTSEDGIRWTSRTVAFEGAWGACACGNPDITLGDSSKSNNTPMWIVVPDDNGYNSVSVRVGKRAQVRCIVQTGVMTGVRILDPGSGYDEAPTYTITDPNNTVEAYIFPRIGDGVLAQPSFVNRGNNYKTSSTQTTVFGDGYADVIPVGQFVTIDGLTVMPGPGAQFRFRGETDYYTVATVELDTQNADGTFSGYFRIGPNLTSDYYLEHGTICEIRERYSQVRITGHDFLDVGTGNFEQTNYPELYTSASFYQAAPENEVYEADGGRVFYTSTDQDGNFRTGELFAVEQATGIVTISADFFDLGGLTELALGGVRLGGSGAVIREFSTDQKFTADSNNVVPTQRAIKAYLQNRLNVGGSDLLTASFIAGTVLVGPNLIRNSASLPIRFPDKVDISGAGAAIKGSIIAQNMFYYSFGRQTGKMGL